MRTIEAETLRKMIDAGEDFLLVNVLNEEAFREHHIPGSLNVPVSRDDFVQHVEREAGGRNRRIVVYCANTECTASPTAAKKLEDAGFTDVVDFEGGMDAWEQANQPVEKGAAH